MQKRWGSKVFKFDIKKSTNGRVNVPIQWDLIRELA